MKYDKKNQDPKITYKARDPKIMIQNNGSNPKKTKTHPIIQSEN